MIATNAAPEAQLLLIDPLRIAIGMSGIEVDTSRNTNIEMDDLPSGSGTDEGSPAITGVSTVSMFQANAVALKAEIWTNWHAATGAVAVLDASAWAGGSP